MEEEVYRARNKALAEIVRSFLESNGIFAFVRTEGLAPYFGEAAEASVYVKAEDRAVAEELIQDFTL